jgi:DNA-binding NtrC family response regulator
MELEGLNRNPDGAQCMILIVEDDPDISKFYSVNLVARNYQIAETSTVKDALHVIQRGLPSLMILDIRLPDGRGWDLLRILDEQQTDYFPVIVATASISPVEVEEHEHSRITHLLFKPIPAKELMRSVEEALHAGSEHGRTIRF